MIDKAIDQMTRATEARVWADAAAWHEDEARIQKQIAKKYYASDDYSNGDAATHRSAAHKDSAAYFRAKGGAA